jgi:uncharacterized protein
LQPKAIYPLQNQITKSDIINYLKAEKGSLQEKFGVVQIGLFGSYASGTPDDESDIDLLVELNEPRFEYLAGLQIFLEQKFNKKIEIIRKSKNINSRFIQKIEQQTIYVFGLIGLIGSVGPMSM